jgi:GT2 family glycosyltransferase/SAM-dependent methyltransferase
MSTIGIIIPTWNNNQYLIPCLTSILSPLATEDLVHVYVVNNGDVHNMDAISHPRVTILQQKDNLGWEGGLKKGLEASKEEFVMFMNDDTYIPLTSNRWTNYLIDHFKYPQVAAVGPSSNCVMGVQNIFSDLPIQQDIVKVNFLIGFCMMVRRSALEVVGGVDDSLPGGDDLDLSIRFRKAGYILLADRNVFVYHHGFKTGERVKGGAEIPGGWNSVQMMERSNFALMEKHSLKDWIECMNQSPYEPRSFDKWNEDSEGKTCQQFVTGDSVLELGCGARKTVPNAVGVDRIAKGQPIRGVAPNLFSLADIQADAEGPLPIESGTYDTVIARHILEHCVDSVSAIREWGRVLKHGGRLIIAVPNHNLRNTIPMNIEHVRAFTPESLKNQMESLGFKTINLLDPQNAISMVGVFETNGLH